MGTNKLLGYLFVKRSEPLADKPMLSGSSGQ